MNIFKKAINKFNREWKEYNIFYFLPVSKKIVLFESSSDFCDNSKAVYDKMVELGLHEKYKLIWFVEDIERFKNLKINNTKFCKLTFGIEDKISFKDKLVYWYYNSRAKNCFYTHKLLGCYTKKSQNRIFLTHGTPLKDSRGKFWNAKYNTYIVSTSDFAADLRCKAFMGGRDKVLNLGFPRNDILFADNSSVKERLNLENFDKVIVWMPTFKHNSSNTSRSDIDSNTDIAILDDEFISSINSYLNEKNGYLIIKYHPGQDMNYVKTLDLSNIKTLTNSDLDKMQVSTYELMAVSDALVTDFSSVYLDYLLTNKPIGFEISDIEKYTSGIGFLVDNPTDYMPGNKIKCKQDFYKFIDDVFISNDQFKTEREKVAKRFYDNIDGNSALRVLEYFKLV